MLLNDIYQSVTYKNQLFCNMKLYSVFTLIILLLSNSLRTSFVYGWYTLDVDSFIEQLCENKNKPQLQCYGKCYLSKVSANNEMQDEQKTPVLEWEQLVFCNTEIILNSQSFQNTASKIITCYILKPTQSFSYSIFHPPQV